MRETSSSITWAVCSLKRARLGHLAAQERMVLAVAEGDRPEPLAHAPVGDHPPGELRGLVQIVLGAGAVFVEDQFLGRPAAQAGTAAGSATRFR